MLQSANWRKVGVKKMLSQKKKLDIQMFKEYELSTDY